MIEKTYKTEFGDIHYYINMSVGSEITLAFLPGLTADHTLLEKQIEYFENKYDILVWDAQGHNSNADRPEEINAIIENFATAINESILMN